MGGRNDQLRESCAGKKEGSRIRKMADSLMERKTAKDTGGD